jgi:CBS domain-containing protein
MTVGDICTRNPEVASKTELVVDVARRMRAAQVEDVVIVEKRGDRTVPIGVICDHDIVAAAVAGDPDHINYLLIGDLINDVLSTVADSDPIETTLAILADKRSRRAVVVDRDGGLVGLLTLDDLLRHETDQQRHLATLLMRDQDRRFDARRR